MIQIGDIILEHFDKEKYPYILDEVNGDSKSNMIHQVEERLNSSRICENLELSNAYLINLRNNIVGYIYLTGKSKKYIYLEYLIFKKYRKQGIGKYTLDNVIDYIFMNNLDLKEIRLNIDRSNLASMFLAESLGFIDDENYLSDKIDFIKDNPYYMKKRK